MFAAMPKSALRQRPLLPGNFAGSLAFAIARDGMVLAGNWERPKRRGVRLDNKRFVRQMNWASAAVRDAICEAAFALLRGLAIAETDIRL